MKNTLLAISYILLQIFISGNSFSNDLKIDLRYVNDENSKHSHGTELNISVQGFNVSYSFISYGYSKNSAIAYECTFTEQDLLNIKTTIESKNLNITDSLVDVSYNAKEFQNTILISLNIIMNDLANKITLKGSTKVLGLSDLYKNSMFFIELLKQMANDRR